jgi:hypothetical protein
MYNPELTVALLHAVPLSLVLWAALLYPVFS